MANSNKDKLKELLGKVTVSTNIITVEDDINHYTILELLNGLRSSVKDLDEIVKDLDEVTDQDEILKLLKRLNVSINIDEYVDKVVNDDWTSAIQQALQDASTTTHYVKLNPRTYKVGRIKPVSNVTLDLNGATLFLINNTEKPMFNNQSGVSNFSIINGRLDLNQANNYAVNQSAGCIWISNSDHLRFENLEIVHAFRNILNFYTCTDVTIKDIYCRDCGMINDNGFFTYGASFEKQCKNINIDNFNMINTYGYGIHLRKTSQAKLSNIYFQDFKRKDTSIGITFTEAENVVVENYKHINGDGLSIECNQSANIIMDNVTINNVKVPFVFGVNASDNSTVRNKQIKITNLTTTNSTGSCSLRLNYINGLIFDTFNIDKGIETLPDIESTDIIFRNGRIGTDMKQTYNDKRFRYENVTLNNIALEKYNYRYTNEIRIPSFNLAVSGTKSINIASDLAVKEGIFCKLLVYSHSTSTPTKSTFTEYMLMVYPGAVYIEETTNSLNGSEAKKVDVSVSGGSLVFTNNSGSQLDVWVKTY